jgi:hypothetical protein
MTKTNPPRPAAGMCYQCRGKGRMTKDDEKRTATYWMHRFRERE